nr:rod shape-determining protein MreC [Marinagarivorans algicola]
MLFTKGPSLGAKIAVLFVVSAVLVGLFVATPFLQGARDKAVGLAAPFYKFADLPRDIAEWSRTRLISRDELIQKNEALRSELLVHQRKLQQLAFLAAENTRLRQLLNSADNLNHRVLVADLVGVAPDPNIHKVFINRGSDDGVYVGQPVVDATGLIGQVVNVSSNDSVVLLISDTSHAIPVQINRNGVRLIAEGRGSVFELGLRHVPSTLDIKEGDLLVSSGLGDIYPAGYPVATVQKITYDPGRPFAEVVAIPKAQLNRNRHVLLVFANKTRFSFGDQAFSAPPKAMLKKPNSDNVKEPSNDNP